MSIRCSVPGCSHPVVFKSLADNPQKGSLQFRCERCWREEADPTLWERVVPYTGPTCQREIRVKNPDYIRWSTVRFGWPKNKLPKEFIRVPCGAKATHSTIEGNLEYRCVACATLVPQGKVWFPL